MMRLNMDGMSFGEWYLVVANHLADDSIPVTPAEYSADPQPGSAAAMFNCNYDARVAADEIRRGPPAPVPTLAEAVRLALLFLDSMTTEQFSLGYDQPLRVALERALAALPAAG